jgi:hypothetical protein
MLSDFMGSITYQKKWLGIIHFQKNVFFLLFFTWRFVFKLSLRYPRILNKSNSCKAASPCLKIMFCSFIKLIKETNNFLAFVQTITCMSPNHNVICNLQVHCTIKNDIISLAISISQLEMTLVP